MNVKRLIQKVDETKQQIAVKKALVGFLKSRYLSRDGLPPQSSISYDRSVVTEDVIELCIGELERQIKKETTELEATLGEDLDG